MKSVKSIPYTYKSTKDRISDYNQISEGLEVALEGVDPRAALRIADSIMRGMALAALFDICQKLDNLSSYLEPNAVMEAPE